MATTSWKIGFFLFTIFVFSNNVFCARAPPAPVCPRSPCESFTIEQTVVNMWNIPAILTPLINQYRNAITSLVHVCNSRILALLTAQTLWSIDMLTNLESDVHPTCVYGNLINRTLAFQKNSNSTNKAALDKAIIQYGGLCGCAINYTVYIGLLAAGCPAKNPLASTATKPEPCDCGDSIRVILQSESCEIPKKLKNIIYEMLESDDPLDNSVATALIGASAKSSIDMFQIYLKNPELLSVMRLKCCNLKIPRKCCPQRQAELRKRCEKLLIRNSNNIEQLTEDDDDD